MARCAHIKPGGEGCAAGAMKGYETCYGHREDLAEERQRNASRGGKAGGRGRGPTEAAQIKSLLCQLTDQVLSGAVETGPAAVVNQLLNTRLRAIEQERKVRETEDLERRLEELEASLQAQRGGARWRA